MSAPPVKQCDIVLPRDREEVNVMTRKLQFAPAALAALVAAALNASGPRGP
jgi:hypothetical protein